MGTGAFDYKSPTPYGPTRRKVFASGKKTAIGNPVSLDTSSLIKTTTNFFPDTSTYVPSVQGFAGSYYILVIPNTNIIKYSTDGSNWSNATLPVSANWSAFTGASNKYMLIARNSNIVLFSTNMTVWTQYALPVSADWIDVSYEISATNYVAVATDSSISAYSTNGTTWTQTALPASRTWTRVRTIQGSTTLVIAIASGTDKVAKSTNSGVTWSELTLPYSKNWFDITGWSGTILACATDNTCIKSLDSGATWSLTNPSLSGTILGVTCYGQSFTAFSWYPAASYVWAVASSDNMSTWAYSSWVSFTGASNSPVGAKPFNCQSYTFNWGGKSRILSLPSGWDGSTYALEYIHNYSVANTYNGYATNGSVHVVCSLNSPSYLYSLDGNNWTVAFLPFLPSTPSVAYCSTAGLFLMVTGVNSTTYYTSPDGLTWTARTFPVTGAWTKVLATANAFCVGKASVASYLMGSATGLTGSWNTSSSPSLNIGNVAGSVFTFSAANVLYTSLNGYSTSTSSSSTFPSTPQTLYYINGVYYIPVSTATSIKLWATTDLTYFYEVATIATCNTIAYIGGAIYINGIGTFLITSANGNGVIYWSYDNIIWYTISTSSALLSKPSFNLGNLGLLILTSGTSNQITNNILAEEVVYERSY